MSRKERERLTIMTGVKREELTRAQQRDKDFWGPIVKASGFKPEL